MRESQEFFAPPVISFGKAFSQTVFVFDEAWDSFLVSTFLYFVCFLILSFF